MDVARQSLACPTSRVFLDLPVTNWFNWGRISRRLRGRARPRLLIPHRGRPRGKMSSLVTKINKVRPNGTHKPAVRKGKKAVSAKGKRKPDAASKQAVTKSKKRAAAIAPSKSKGVKAVKASPKRATAKKGGKPVAVAAPSRRQVKSGSTNGKGSKRALSRKPVSRQVASRPAQRRVAESSPAVRGTANKPVVHHEPKIVSPDALQAIRAFERALTEFNRQDFDTAKGSFENILAKFGDQTDVIAKVRTYLAICDQRLARTPSTPRNNPDALYNQGVFEFNRGNTREAIEIFRKALKANPRADHVLYSLAASYARVGDVPGAMDALRRAIMISPLHRSHARHDPDFSSLRANLEFRRLSGMPIDVSD